MKWLRIFRVIFFATIYFFIYVASAFYFLIKSYAGSSQVSGYLQNPWVALRTIFDYILSELPRSPLLMLTLFTLILQSVALGFVTDWVLRLLMRHLQFRKKRQETKTKE